MPEKSIKDELDYLVERCVGVSVEEREKMVNIAFFKIEEILKREIEGFCQRVEKRAEQKMLLTHKLEGAHYAAMKELLVEEIK